MGYRQRFLTEVKRFEECNTAQALLNPTEEGLRQFFDYESKGKWPSRPDPYFTFLLDGKRWWEWTLNFYAAQYGTADWPGWYCLALDFKDDPAGFRQLRRRCGFDPLDPRQIIEKCDAISGGVSDGT